MVLASAAGLRLSGPGPVSAGSIPCAASSVTTWVNQPTLTDNRRLNVVEGEFPIFNSW